MCSLCIALSPRTKLIIQMAKMINLRTCHLHVKIHLPPAAWRLGSSQLVTASRKMRSVNSSTTRLCCSFQQDQAPQDGNFGVVKSAEQELHRVLIVKDRRKSHWCAFGSGEGLSSFICTSLNLSRAMSETWIYCHTDKRLWQGRMRCFGIKISDAFRKWSYLNLTQRRKLENE